MSSILKSRTARTAGKFLFILFTVIFAVWASLAMWFQLPFGDAVRASAVGAWLLFITWVIQSQRHINCRISRVLFLTAAAILLIWWSTIQPSLSRIWAPEVSRTVQGEIDGNFVTLFNVRDFEWTTTDNYKAHWNEETYDLTKLTTVDTFLSYWAGPSIAHTLVSFGFEDGRHVVFSGEIRKEHHEEFSSIGGFFREFELAMIAAEERDIIFLRTNVREEDVFRYRINISPEAARELFVSYVELGNELAAKPKFYNTLSANCTTIIYKMARVLDPTFPFDYRVVLSGYLPGYLYDHDWLDQSEPLEQLRKQASINQKAQAGGREGFSERIRN